MPKICKIFREENEELTGFENEEILAEYQIYKTPGYVYMKGNVQIYQKLPDEERKLIVYMLQKGVKLEQECISEYL